MGFFYAALSFLALCLQILSLSFSSYPELHLLNLGSPAGFAWILPSPRSDNAAWKLSQGNKWGQSWPCSGITGPHHLVSCVLKIIVSYILFGLGCFKSENKFSPCYSVLVKSASPCTVLSTNLFNNFMELFQQFPFCR